MRLSGWTKRRPEGLGAGPCPPPEDRAPRLCRPQLWGWVTRWLFNQLLTFSLYQNRFSFVTVSLGQNHFRIFVNSFPLKGGKE